MKPTSRQAILKALSEQKISKKIAFDLIRKLSEDVPSTTASVETSPAKEQHTPVNQPMTAKHANTSTEDDRVAIIGISGVFPDAQNVDEFWQNISNGVDSVREVPSTRWDVDAHFDTDRTVEDKTYSKWAGTVEDIASFDP